MRIKIGSYPDSILKDVSNFFNYKSNANSIKMMLVFGIRSTSKEKFDYENVGFEIDTHVLFSDEEYNYYLELIKNRLKIDKVEKENIVSLINVGAIDLNIEINMSKDLSDFMNRNIK